MSWGVWDFMKYLTRSLFYGSCPLVKLLLGFSWIRLRVVPHFSSGIVERAKHERAWKSPHARKGDTCHVWGDFHARSRFARSTIPEERWGTTRSLYWMGKGGLFLIVALFVGPQYSKQNQSMANNEKTFMWLITMMNLALRWSYFCTYLQCWSEIWMDGGGGSHVFFTRH